MKYLITAFFIFLVFFSTKAQYRTQAQQLVLTSEDSLNTGTAKNKTVISGYGSAAYQRNFDIKQSTITLERAVLFIGHQFNNKIAVFTEMELENAKVEGWRTGWRNLYGAGLS